MKKLKLYGEKGGRGSKITGRFVAIMYVKNGEIIVESKHPKLKEKLQEELKRMAQQGAFRIGKHKEIRDKRGRLIEHQSIEFFQKPADPEFLEAVKSAVWFWDVKKFGGFKINPLVSKIIEE